MSINKNFVVKHGLEVNENLIYADPDTNQVGINTALPEYTLDVKGEIGVSTITIKDELILEGVLSIGSSVGKNGQYLISTGDSVAWQNIPSNRVVEKVVGTTGQSSFSIAYIPGLIDVFINGVKLSDDEFTATDGVTVVLNDSCFGGETVEFIVYSAYNVAGVSTFGITIQDEGVTVGTPNLITSLNFVGSSVIVTSNGIGATITFTDLDTNYWEVTDVGIHTLSNVGIGTTDPTSALTVGGDISVSGVITSTSLIIEGGLSSEFLKADGSLDSNDYLITTGSGENLTGIVTSILSGTGINVDQSTGEVTISSLVENYWEVTDVGIHTLSNVGIGTTDPTSALTVEGSGSFSEIVTATEGFISIGNTTPIQIILNGNELTFTAVGIGSTTLTLF
jgi:hypothetical protein